jgi:Tfp pilus assembly protein PilF
MASDHMRAMQIPDSAHVLGDFYDAEFAHFDDMYRFVHAEGEDGSRIMSVIASRGGQKEDEEGLVGDTLKVEWAFGHDPLQQVLLAGDRGRLQALNVAWDVEKEEWYSLYPDEATPPGDVLDWQGDRMSWNYMCAACHTTGLERGYDVETDSYETTWAESTVGCESCHGPGSNHVENPAAGFGMTGASEEQVPASGRTSMAVLESELTMCASCHSRRTPLVEPPVHGASFLDQFAPGLISDGLYYDDGQIRDEVYVYGSYLQSGMAQAGVTCSDCHDPHTGMRRLPGNALCMSCHAGKVEDVPVHLAHVDGEAATDCETCHMPDRTFMGIDDRGDHRFGIPDPITSRTIGSRNVCADCHGDNTDVERILQGPESRPGLAVMALRASTTDRMAIVEDVLVDSTVSRFEKGSLIARLGSVPTTDALRVVMTALSSGNPFERVGALRAIADPAFRAPLPNLEDRFADSLRWVRAEAVATALAHAYDRFGDEPARTALAEYEAAQLAVAEQPEAHLNLASMHEVTGDMAAADQAYERAVRLAPDNADIATGYGLMLGRWANRVVQNPGLDQTGPTYRLLRTRGEAELARAVEIQGDNASRTLTLLGLYLGEERPRLPAAAAALDEAWRLDNSNRQAIFNAAISYHQMGEVQTAEARYRAGMARHPDFLDLKDAFITLLMQTDRWEEASELNQELRDAMPGQTQWLERQALIDSQIRERANRAPAQDSD